MTKIEKRYGMGCVWTGLVGPYVKKRPNTAQMDSRKCTLLFAVADEYEFWRKVKCHF